MHRFTALACSVVGTMGMTAFCLAQAAAPAAPTTDKPLDIKPIEFETETLSNGLRVVYAPMDNAPVVHVRVLYHVGSKDEIPTRQGFAHMFEHMMFRGSAHVPPEQHMRLIGNVGGDSNAFTSFDQTTYVNTIPANQLELALYLEADRMAGFKVNEDKFSTERNVVAEEWRMRYANPPYGTLFADVLGTMFTAHHYRWTPIGNMDQLKAAEVEELQAFFDTYYVPNNAVLAIAGDIDVDKAKEMVHKYYDWIPTGGEIKRVSAEEPTQTENRELTRYRKAAPVPITIVTWPAPGTGDKDEVALDLLTTILGGGASSRLYQELAAGDEPIAASIDCGYLALEDYGAITLSGAVLPGKEAETLRAKAIEVLETARDKGVSQEELDKARTQAMVSIVRNRETATEIAGALAEAWAFEGDPNRVNEMVAQYRAVTTADLKRVANKYIQDGRRTVVTYLPDPLGMHKEETPDDKFEEGVDLTADSSRFKADVQRNVEFPKDWPTEPPLSTDTLKAEFAKGVELKVDGTRVYVLEDHRLPLVSFSAIMPGGSDSLPAEKAALGSMTAGLMGRGAADMDQAEWSADLESRGIALGAGDSGDHVSITGSTTTNQLETLMTRAKQLMTEPALPEDEFAKLKNQAVTGLKSALAEPDAVANMVANHVVFGDSPAGREPSLQGIESLNIDDVKDYHKKAWGRDDAFLVFAGDVTEAQAKDLATKFLADWSEGGLPEADRTYEYGGRRIVVVDNPEGAQAELRIVMPAYTLEDDSKYAGSVATNFLSGGIDAYYNNRLRAELGLIYSAFCGFQPGRYTGQFEVNTDTKLESVGQAVDESLKLVTKLQSDIPDDKDIKDSKTNIVGGMVMGMQTINQQAAQRVRGILNGYPADYYDVYPQKIAPIDPNKVSDVLKKYAKPDQMSIIVVGPAETLVPQLEQFGKVEVQKMPLASE